MIRITTPRDISLGQGALKTLQYVSAKRALIVTDANMVRLGLAERVAKVLQQNKVDTRIFAEVEPDPSQHTCERGGTLAREFGPDLIVGLGGGSALDAGKSVWVFYEYPDATWDWIFSRPRLTQLRQKARYVAIPTTSGTGSEVTFFAVVTDRRGAGPVKRGYGSRELAPDLAIVDPELCLSMPPSVTADTGLDALVHAVECYVSVAANDYSDALALKAIQDVFAWLPRAVAHGDDVQAREKMHVAATLAGLAFTNADLGLVHALAHQLGAVFGVPHGRANGMLLPIVVRYNASVAAPRYAQIARAIGIRDGGDASATTALVEAIERLQREVGVPARLKDLKLDRASFDANLEALAQNAHQDGSRPGNPRGAEVSDIRELFFQAWG